MTFDPHLQILYNIGDKYLNKQLINKHLLNPYHVAETGANVGETVKRRHSRNSRKTNTFTSNYCWDTWPRSWRSKKY